MLEEKVQELRSNKRKSIDTKIELDLSYVLDESLFLSENDKLNFFREIENIDNLIELDEIEQEMRERIEREGIDEKSLSGLRHFFLLIRSRIIFREYSVIKLSRVGMYYVFDLDSSVSPERVRAFLDRFDRKKQMSLLSLTKIRVEKRYWKDTEGFLSELLGG